MSTAIKPIETHYKGYRFRSRLEARWAVFFDTLGIRYEYEKEGYQLGKVRYLPDFWLPELDCWVEIKGPHPTKEEQIKLATLTSKDNNWMGIIRSGTPDTISNEGYGYALGKCIGLQAFIECLHCGTIGSIMYNPEGKEVLENGFVAFPFKNPPLVLSRLRCDCRKKKYGSPSLTDYTTGSPRLTAAYTAARSARFEHGERGRS